MQRRPKRRVVKKKLSRRLRLERHGYVHARGCTECRFDAADDWAEWRSLCKPDPFFADVDLFLLEPEWFQRRAARAGLPRLAITTRWQMQRILATVGVDDVVTNELRIQLMRDKKRLDPVV